MKRPVYVLCLVAVALVTLSGGLPVAHAQSGDVYTGGDGWVMVTQAEAPFCAEVTCENCETRPGQLTTVVREVCGRTEESCLTALVNAVVGCLGPQGVCAGPVSLTACQQ